jgi:hypothetical protein
VLEVNGAIFSVTDLQATVTLLVLAEDVEDEAQSSKLGERSSNKTWQFAQSYRVIYIKSYPSRYIAPEPSPALEREGAGLWLGIRAHWQAYGAFRHCAATISQAHLQTPTLVTGSYNKHFSLPCLNQVEHSRTVTIPSTHHLRNNQDSSDQAVSSLDALSLRHQHHLVVLTLFALESLLPIRTSSPSSPSSSPVRSRP